MEAYLDNSATTRCCEEAAQLVVKLLTEIWFVRYCVKIMEIHLPCTTKA